MLYGFGRQDGPYKLRFSEAQPFFQLDGGEGEEADGDDVEPGFGAHGGGVEEAVHHGQIGEGELRQPGRGDAGEEPRIGEKANGKDRASPAAAVEQLWTITMTLTTAAYCANDK